MLFVSRKFVSCSVEPESMCFCLYNGFTEEMYFLVIFFPRGWKGTQWLSGTRPVPSQLSQAFDERTRSKFTDG